MTQDIQWGEPQPVEVPEFFQQGVGGHPLVAATLYRRGVTDLAEARAFLHPDAYEPTPAETLPDMEPACRILSAALSAKRRILIWGDFDVDGQTATTLLVEALQELGGQVAYHIPIRETESHGISPTVLDAYLEKGFDLLLTCDTGISEHKAIRKVREAGIPVLVTDHHSLGRTLPPADAVINPQRLAPDHPLRTLPGVGVAHKLMEGLHRYLDREFNPDPSLELTALGIVADVAELQGDTRYLLQRGLQALRHTRRIGLQTLLENAGINPLNLDESHIGFQIAPRLNALGRLGDANPVVELMTTGDIGRARVLATQIEAMNTKRRFLTRQVDRAAEKQLASTPDDRRAPAIVLHHPQWPGGVVGIVASRLVERYQKPVILLTGENQIHGSARSIPGINVTEAIGSQAELLEGYGGHPMAAGLSLAAENLGAFKRGFWGAVAEQSRGRVFVPELPINGVLTLEEMTLDLVTEINRLAPFGPGNPPLHFLVRDLRVVSAVVVGRNGEHKQIIAEDAAENRQRFIWWNGGDQPAPEADFDLVCQLNESDYQGTRQISAEWLDFRISRKGKAALARRYLDVSDHRDALQPHQALKEIRAQCPHAPLWAEGPDADGIDGLPRNALPPAQELIIWTAPPDAAVLQTVLARVHPERVIVFALLPQQEGLKAFLGRLGGLVKYALRHKGGETSLSELAGACAATEDSVRIGLELWAAQGAFQANLSANAVQIFPGKGQTAQDNTQAVLKEILTDLLAEARAYRRFFRRGRVENVFPDREITSLQAGRNPPSSDISKRH